MFHDCTVDTDDRLLFEKDILGVPVYTKKPITVDVTQRIGEGAYANVFRISKRRVVKVILSSSPDSPYDVVVDEVRGSKKFCFSLPVLRIVLVSVFGGKYYGLVKRFIPRKVTAKDRDKVVNRKIIYNHDMKTRNFRADSKGRVYWVDTQLLETPELVDGTVGFYTQLLETPELVDGIIGLYTGVRYYE